LGRRLIWWRIFAPPDGLVRLTQAGRVQDRRRVL